jgi:hypothetical protein
VANGGRKGSGYDARPVRVQGRPDLANTNPDGIYSGSMKRLALSDGEFLPETSSARRRTKKTK